MKLVSGKKQILEWLQTAVELEWSTIPPYLTALISLHRDHNRIPADIIRTVMIEEMLHMTLVSNVALSLSGEMRIDASNVPQYPLNMTFEGYQFKDRQFDIDLAAFSRATLETFLKIELPADLAPHEMALVAEETVPGLTIGDFYNMIIEQLRELCNRYGEGKVFSGRPELQIGPGYYWSSGGVPIVVTDLSTATIALAEIVEQGEGAHVQTATKSHAALPDSPVPHYFRFREIKAERFYRATDDLRQEPTGDLFEVDYSAVYSLLKNPRADMYARSTPLALLNDSFNRSYTLMLVQIQEAFSGSPRTLYTAIMDGMQTLTSIALQMASTPIPGRDANGAPSFEWHKS